MIREGVVTTLNADGSVHPTPLGYRREGDAIVLAPFEPSLTLQNLRRSGVAVMNLVDDVRIVAGCLTGRRDWPVRPADCIPGFRLEDALAHIELEVDRCEEDVQRPSFFCHVRHLANHAPFLGHSRAQSAVIEAAILATRLDWLDPERVAGELHYLATAVSKTAGDSERQAWEWLMDYIAAHPRHGAGKSGTGA